MQREKGVRVRERLRVLGWVGGWDEGGGLAGRRWFGGSGMKEEGEIGFGGESSLKE